MYRPHSHPDFKRQPKHLILKYFKGCLYTVRLKSPSTPSRLNCLPISNVFNLRDSPL